MSYTCEEARSALAPDPGIHLVDAVHDQAIAHYRTCADCRRFFGLHAELASRIRAAGRTVEAPESLRARILAQLGAETARPRRRTRLGLLSGGLAAAATAVLALTLGPTHRTPPAGLPLVDQARGAHASLETALAEPLGAFFTLHRVGGFDIPEIPNARMVRGRVTDVGGAPSAAVDFRTAEGYDLTYLMVPGTGLFHGVDRSDVMTMRTGEWEVAMWVEGGTARAVLSTMPRPALLAIADECRAKRAL